MMPKFPRHIPAATLATLSLAATMAATLATTMGMPSLATAAAPPDPATLRDRVSIDTLVQSPSVSITNGLLSAKIYLPDSGKGFYRGSRFDWAGVIGSLRYRGHDYYTPWFQSMAPGVRDFVFGTAGEAIAGPNTAATGPVEEFNGEGGALGFSEAAPGGRFVKIGVGVLQRPDAAAFSAFTPYPIVDAGKRTQRISRDQVALTHAVTEPGSGYAYRYTKTLRLLKGQPVLLIEHELRNTGRKPIATQVYSHNFLNMDGVGTTASLELSTPFELGTDQPPNPQLAGIAGHKFSYLAAPTIDQRVTARLTGFGGTAADYDFRIVDRATGTGLRITADQPLDHVVLWSIRPVMAIEPFVKMTIPPGKTFRWTYRYAYEATSDR